MTDLEKTLNVGDAWREAEKLPTAPGDGGRDRTLTWIFVVFVAQALPLALACLVTGGC
jgi:hypothetical protein